MHLGGYARRKSRAVRRAFTDSLVRGPLFVRELDPKIRSADTHSSHDEHVALFEDNSKCVFPLPRHDE
jgi:hypothetical protein